MLHKIFSRCLNAKLLPFSNLSKIRNKNLFNLGSEVNFKSISSSQKDGNVLKTLYPTQHVDCKRFQSGTVDNDTPKESRPGLNLTTRYSFKFLWALMQDRGVKYHLGRSFLDGIGAAFLFVSDCLYKQNYDDLTEVVTPELLQRIKNQKICSQSADESVFLAKNVIFVTLANMHWSVNKQTKIKTIEVLVRFSYFDKKVQFPQSFEGLMSVIKTRKVEGSTMNFAHLKFFRTYGEEMKDSPWVIKDLLYFTANERLQVPSR